MEVLRILIKPTGSNQVNSGKGFFNMVLFEGECECENFKGKVYTDSEALRWLEDADLTGHLIFEEGNLIISICTE